MTHDPNEEETVTETTLGSHPVYRIDGEPVEDPEAMEEQLTPAEREAVLTLAAGESVTVGGGAFAARVVERVR